MTWSGRTTADKKTPGQRNGKKISYSKWSESAKEDFRARCWWRAQRMKEHLVEMFGGKCSRCDYDKCIRALEFHHIDPKKKKFEVNKGTITKRPWKQVLAEANKCDLLCSNCHREIEDAENKGRYASYADKYSHIFRKSKCKHA